jgi:GT2 family glycosyltransferase
MERVFIGLVTYDEEINSLQRFLRSLEKSYSELDTSKYSVSLVHICCGRNIELKSNAIKIYQLKPKGNLGYPNGCNELMNFAFNSKNADFFIGSNPDGMFFYNTLSELLNFSENFQNAIIEARQFPEEHPKIYDPVTYDTPWASGCCLLLPKKIYDAVGSHDKNFFLYIEDVDYSWRAKIKGFDVKICPTALYAHSVMGREPSRFVQKCFLESGRYLGHKWNNRNFKRFCENALIKETFYDSLEELPGLPEECVVKNVEKYKCIINFDRYFHFADARWD